jgi:hypothetical protein
MEGQQAREGGAVSEAQEGPELAESGRKAKQSDLARSGDKK